MSVTKPKCPDWMVKRRVFDGFRMPACTREDYFRSALVYEPQKDDLLVASYPKSGTTWTQYIVCLIYSNGVPPEGPIMFGATPFLEYIGAQGTDEYQRPVPIKTHLPFNLTPFSEEAKYIYVVRNPKDTCVSYYFHVLKSEAHCDEYRDMPFDQFFEMFIDGTTDWNDYFDHVVSWYEQRHRKNILFITYEEMKMDIRAVIKRIATFMGNPWSDMVNNDDQLLDKIVDESGAAKMKVNIDQGMKVFDDPVAMERLFPPRMKALMEETASCMDESMTDWNFIRKGKVGDWVNHLSEEQNARLTAKARSKLANCPDLLSSGSWIRQQSQSYILLIIVVPSNQVLCIYLGYSRTQFDSRRRSNRKLIEHLSLKDSPNLSPLSQRFPWP
ncbi:Sulfotransferase 1C2 [Halotydeus destructor]|nr:Sulfotransferase 1C2 [Halotydeus destructor]